MTPTSKLTLFALSASLLVALSVSAVTPSHARGGGRVGPYTKFMMENGARFHMNTREEALARQQQGQLASAEEDSEQADDPGWFIELISICDHLKDTGVTCE